MSPIGGTGPQADREAAWEAIRLRLCLLPKPTGKPFADFWIGLEADESAPKVAGWLQLAECVMSRIGAADSLWWAFLHDGPNGLPHMHISTYLVDSSGQAVVTGLRLGRLNLDGSIRIRTAGSDQ